MRRSPSDKQCATLYREALDTQQKIEETVAVEKAGRDRFIKQQLAASDAEWKRHMQQDVQWQAELRELDAICKQLDEEYEAQRKARPAAP